MQEELSLRKQQEERWKMEELKSMEKVFYNALIEETKRRHEREEKLKIARQKKNALFGLYNSEHWKRSNADMQSDKRSKMDGSHYAYYWTEEFSEAIKKRTPPIWCRRNPDMSEELKRVKPWVEVQRRLLIL